MPTTAALSRTAAAVNGSFELIRSGGRISSVGVLSSGEFMLPKDGMTS
jgi:hypothetical protein